MRNHPVRRILIISVVATVLIVCTICAAAGFQRLSNLNFQFGTSSAAAAYPNTKFAVVSDTHLYDTSLGTAGNAFEKCMESDRKLLKNSEELISFGMKKIEASGAKFVLVTGDLTKDGELLNHQKMAAQLSALRKQGIKVYVVPGNHDVSNPGAVRYAGNKETTVPNITAAQFAEIYKNCGYGDAILRDPSSLSYVAQPQAGLWIVALDSCRYSENKPGGTETVGGRLTQAEVNWLEGVLGKAEQQKKAVIVMQHHGIVEHWKGQSSLHPDYLVQDYQNIGKLLASYHVRAAFTGHYHAQDITEGTFGTYGSLYDIETGSMITPPCPVRYCTISAKKLNVSTERMIGEIHPGTDFQKNADIFVRKTILNEANEVLNKYHVVGNDADLIANQVASAFVAHYNGDEDPTKRPAFDESKLSLWGRIAYAKERYVLDGLWNDLPPADNKCTIPLN